MAFYWWLGLEPTGAETAEQEARGTAVLLSRVMGSSRLDFPQ